MSEVKNDTLSALLSCISTMQILLQQLLADVDDSVEVVVSEDKVKSMHFLRVVDKYELKKQVPAELIIGILEEFFMVNITQKSRFRQVVKARDIACYFMHRFTDLSLKDIAEKTGNSDHSTVIHSVKKVLKYLEERPSWKELIERLAENILALNKEYSQKIKAV
jgi:chromosomal replication initiation ATPase DnaA